MLYQLKKIFKWIKLIWNDYDFDSYYLLDIILLKVEFMIPVFEDGFCEGSEERAKVLKEILWIGRKIKEDSFGELCLDDNEWNKLNKQERVDYFTKQDSIKQEYVNKFFNLLRDNFIGMWD